MIDKLKNDRFTKLFVTNFFSHITYHFNFNCSRNLIYKLFSIYKHVFIYNKYALKEFEFDINYGEIMCDCQWVKVTSAE